MTFYIGSVSFDNPLFWPDRDDSLILRYESRTRGGSIITITPESDDDAPTTAKWLFEWISWSDVQALKALQASGATVSACPEGGTTYSVRLMAKNGVTNVKHAAWGDEAPKRDLLGKPTDLYNGEINVWIVG